jgi:hypothetical protein
MMKVRKAPGLPYLSFTNGGDLTTTQNGVHDNCPELGYIAMALDMYGNGKTADNPDAAGKLATPFYKTRK